MRRATYAATSPFRLTDAELAHLVEACGDQVFGSPLFVDDGYDIGGSQSTDSGWVTPVGRAGLYERIALQRLTSGQHDRGLRGLFYPGATPSPSILYQAALYFVDRRGRRPRRRPG